MPWSAEYSPDDLIVITHSGIMTRQDYRTEATEVLQLARDRDIRRFLVDNTTLEPTLGAADIYDFPRIYDELAADRAARIAVISSPQDAVRRNLQFYETVCVNRGYNVRLFDTREQALDWLRAG